MDTDNKLLKISFISVNFDFYNRPMEWTTAHDVLLCREIFLQEFYKFKKGSNERGRTWIAWTRVSPLWTILWLHSGLDIGQSVPSTNPKQLSSGASFL